MSERTPYFVATTGQEYVAGWHDGVNSHVSQHAVHMPEVAAHEGIHNRVMRETHDGAALLGMQLALRYGKLNAESRACFQQTIEANVLQSLIAHEAIATYLGIISLPLQMHDEARSRLQSQYKSYFDEVSPAIEEVYGGTFAAYAFVWGLARVAFSSPLLEGVGKSDWTSPVGVKTEECATARLRAIMKAVSCKTMKVSLSRIRDSALQICKSAGIAEWDVTDDEAWNALKPTAGIARVLIECAIGRHAIDFALEHTKLAICGNRSSTFAVKRLAKTLEGGISGSLTLICPQLEGLESENDPATVRIARRGQAALSQSSLIINETAAIGVSKLQAATAEDVLGIVEDHSFALCARADGNVVGEWIWMRWQTSLSKNTYLKPGVPPTKIVRMSGPEVAKTLALIASARDSGKRIPICKVVVCPYLATGTGVSFNDYYRGEDGDQSDVIPPERLIQYAWELVVVVEGVLRVGSSVNWTLIVDHARPGDADNFFSDVLHQRVGAKQGLLLRSSALTSPVLRIYDTNSAAVIISYLASGDLGTRLSYQDVSNELEDAINWSMALISMFWKSY